LSRRRDAHPNQSSSSSIIITREAINHHPTKHFLQPTAPSFIIRPATALLYLISRSPQYLSHFFYFSRKASSLLDTARREKKQAAVYKALTVSQVRADRIESNNSRITFFHGCNINNDQSRHFYHAKTFYQYLSSHCRDPDRPNGQQPSSRCRI
jgi:hypothetical protein